MQWGWQPAGVGRGGQGDGLSAEQKWALEEQRDHLTLHLLCSRVMYCLTCLSFAFCILNAEELTSVSYRLWKSLIG